MTELTDEERALLEAEDEVQIVPEEITPEPKRRPRKLRAVSTSVEVEVTSEEHRVVPAQWHGDPWGDTPAQSRF